MGHFYDDPDFSYLDYWKTRNYEHESEIIALKNLLGTRHFQTALDLGGGYGRLASFLTSYAKQVLLVEPSLKQRNFAKSHLKGIKNIKILAGTCQKTKLPDQSCDLVVMVRVMHHLTETSIVLNEIHRILKPNGVAIIEFANSLNLKSRIMSFISGKPILPAPIDRRRAVNIRNQTIPFVNHHPVSLQKLLIKSGYKIDKLLSVSNFRGLPFNSLKLENWLQKTLASIYFGPSIFVKVQRLDRQAVL
ncbi:class I SAM-dependent methyltransferase [Candidatus Amesbacteria bacterium]|nr:class I SAM-dependent methyltransferase [Candidatus Amesbacteria bacterium]